MYMCMCVCVRACEVHDDPSRVQVYLNSRLQHKHSVVVGEVVGRQHADEHLAPLYCEDDVAGVR